MWEGWLPRGHPVCRSPLPRFVLVRQLGEPTDLPSGSAAYRPSDIGASVCMTVQWEWEILQDDIGSSSRWREKMSMEGTGRRSPTAMLAPSIPLPQDARASLWPQDTLSGGLETGVVMSARLRLGTFLM